MMKEPETPMGSGSFIVKAQASRSDLTAATS